MQCPLVRGDRIGPATYRHHRRRFRLANGANRGGRFVIAQPDLGLGGLRKQAPGIGRFSMRLGKRRAQFERHHGQTVQQGRSNASGITGSLGGPIPIAMPGISAASVDCEFMRFKAASNCAAAASAVAGSAFPRPASPGQM